MIPFTSNLPVGRRIASGELIERAKEVRFTSLVITVHDGLYGALKFVRAVYESGIGSITGVELALINGSHLALLSGSTSPSATASVTDARPRIAGTVAVRV
jgi:DNA polymerase III alpha subunit